MLKRITILLILTCSLFNINAYANSITVKDTVSGNWYTDTVFVIDNIILPEEQTLIIDPGTRIIFSSTASFEVQGLLVSIGDENNVIIFQVDDTNGFYYDTIPDGGWKGIKVNRNMHEPDSLIFEYCNFFNCKAVSDTNILLSGGVLHIQNYHKLRISNCIFQDNYASFSGAAVYLKNSDILINGCTFINNRCGLSIDPYGYGGAVCSDSSKCEIFNNTFINNSSTGVGGALAVRFQDARVCNNSFSENYSALGGAIGFLHFYSASFSQCNNLIYNNFAEFFGGGIANLDASPVYLNNTIVYNYSVYGGGFYVKDSIIPEIYNSILWGNLATSGFGHQVYLWDSFATANLYYCDIQGGKDDFGGSGGGAAYQGIYENNIEVSPHFIDSIGVNFRLSASSSCINIGTPDTSGLLLPASDLDGSERIIDGRIDIGCYESLSTNDYEINKEINSDKIFVYPNPSNGYFLFQIDHSCKAKLYVYDLMGKLLYVNEIVVNGNEKIELNLNGLVKGFYLVSIVTDEKTYVQKVSITR